MSIMPIDLKISETIARHRKRLNLTQEELADRLGVSPQAVSNWERGGYPDITMLPVLANQFGISIDELMGSDSISREAEFDVFRNKFGELRSNPAEQVQFALEYYRKYPKEYWIADMLGDAITKDKEHLSENYPILREVCEKILAECTWYWTRDNAVSYMCMACPDEEFSKWNDMCAMSYGSFREEIREDRLWYRGQFAECRVRHDVNNFLLLCHFLFRNNRTDGVPEKGLAWAEHRMRTVESLWAEDGIPPAWLGLYAEASLQASWFAMDCGKTDEGYEHLDRAFAYYEKWAEIPDGTCLDVGDPMIFGGVKAIKKEWDYAVPKSDAPAVYEREWSPYSLLFMQGKNDLLYGLTVEKGSGWLTGCEGFACVRRDERFMTALERARSLAE